MAMLGVARGDRIEVRSQWGRIVAFVAPDETVKRGVVSISHAWGGLPGDSEAESGACTNRLVGDARVESINAMAWMTGIPVQLQAAKSEP
jgi:anaerobic selenocysteine-containing dehydrogenase